MRSLVALWLLGGCLLSAQEQQRLSTPAQRYQMFQASLNARAAAISLRSLAGIEKPGGWAHRKAEVRKELLSMLGLDPMPARTPLHAQRLHVPASAGLPLLDLEAPLLADLQEALTVLRRS